MLALVSRAAPSASLDFLSRSSSLHQNPNRSLGISPPPNRIRILRLRIRSDGKSGPPAEDEEGKTKVNFRWVDLLLNPDPDNIVAVGLTGVLTWASAQVLWQLFLVSASILLAALKYTIVAALLIFILITLL